MDHIHHIFSHIFNLPSIMVGPYPDAMQLSVLTQDYVQKNDIKPICSPVNVEAYRKIFHQNGRRSCVGVVSRSQLLSDRKSMLELKDHDLKASTLGSISCGTPEYPALECQPYESIENHLGNNSPD